jgi:hypothetical protein
MFQAGGSSGQPGGQPDHVPGVALGWWLLGWLLISSGSTELLAAALQGLALALAADAEEACPWCGSRCWVAGLKARSKSATMSRNQGEAQPTWINCQTMPCC